MKSNAARKGRGCSKHRATGFSCLQLYNKLQALADGLTDIDDNTLTAIEEQKFKTAKTNLDGSKNASVIHPALFQGLFKKLTDEVDEKRISNKR